MLQALIDAEATQHIGAQPYERTTPALPTATAPELGAIDQGRRMGERASQRVETSSCAPSLGAGGLGNIGGVFTLGGLVERSLRRRGQRLVVVGALLGALIGVALGLVVEDAGMYSGVAAPGHGVSLAASPPSSQPTASRTAGSGSLTAGNDASGSQRAESADRSDKRHANARKDGEGRQDKHGHDKPGKGKNK